MAYDFLLGNVLDRVVPFEHNPKPKLNCKDHILLEKFFAGEYRDLGIDKCIEAAKEIFIPELIRDWDSLTPEKKRNLIQKYADRSASAFELKIYSGVYFESIPHNKLGYNNSNGSIYLNKVYITNNRISPIELLDTIAHDLKHQYQFEAVNGLHSIPEDVRNEWKTGFEEYTLGASYVYAP